ncbi:MAG: hypothetical protein U0Q16_05205 [Bryobacteraceae bacterium]
MLKDQSTIGDKAQTTIPKVCRDAFGLAKGDALRWEIDQGQRRFIVTFVREADLRSALEAARERTLQAYEEGKARVLQSEEDIARLEAELSPALEREKASV